MVAFERCYCVTLPRRGDRWEEFSKRLPAPWPLPPVTRFDAIDGRLCKPPAWWTSGRGAWGCYRSHLAILEKCLNDAVDSLVIFEDDCTFTPEFSSAVAALDIPGDCEQLYFGGQHLIAPEPVDQRVDIVRCRNVNRTHAYAVVGREAIAKLYSMLNDTPGWVRKYHIDHTYGRLQESCAVNAYAVSPWLCGQSAGSSDVCERKVPERLWKYTPPTSPLPFVAIMGLHRSGSSALAMLCHKLGISMGRKLTGWEGRHGGGGEAVTLAWLCEQWARFPTTQPQVSFDAAGHLKAWIAGRVADDSAAGMRTGGKYPHLCAMGGMLASACGEGLKVIDIRRPIEQSIDSLVRRSQIPGAPKATAGQAEAVQRWLWDKREAFLRSFDTSRVLRIEYTELCRDPHAIAREIAQFVGIECDEVSVDAACSHIVRYAEEVVANV